MWLQAEVRLTCHVYLIRTEMSYFVSNGDGLVVTVDSESGDVLWIQTTLPRGGSYIWQRGSAEGMMDINVAVRPCAT